MKSQTVTVGTAEPMHGAPVVGPVLIVAEHPDSARLGDRLSLERGRKLCIGRRAPELGPAPLGDAKISSTHVEVFPDGDRLVIEDRGSKNGVFVAGPDDASRRVDRATLSPGEFFQIGATFLRYVIEPAFAIDDDPELVGRSFAAVLMRRAIAASALHDRAVLVVGATGSGKELVARAVHRRSGRKGELLAINCATLSADLAEAELFGHTKGAYTGADRERPGLFRSAQGGTVFLDEIGTLPLALQPKLLRVLQERSVRPVGASREEKVDVRVVAATNEHLAERVKIGAFREDLYSRLLGGRVSVPGLGDRREDIALLGRALLSRAGHADLRFSEALTWRLLRNEWPLNVRALEQILLAAAPLARRGVLDLTGEIAELLDEQTDLSGIDKPDGQKPQLTAPDPRRYTRQPSRDDLLAHLESAGGNVARVAEAYGVRRQQIYRWAEALGVDLSAYR